MPHSASTPSRSKAKEIPLPPCFSANLPYSNLPLPLLPPSLPTEKFADAKKWGATDCLNPKDYDKPIQAVLVEKSPTGFGIDYTYDCTGNVQVRLRVCLLSGVGEGAARCCVVELGLWAVSEL